MDTLQLVENRILLAPGELSGYTGWARPKLNLAGHYQLIGVMFLFETSDFGHIAYSKNKS